MSYKSRALFGVLLCALPIGLVQGADDAAASRLKEQAALKPFGGLVGGWKGSGQPERGKAKGSWLEKSSWAWKLTSDSAGLEVEVERGKYLKHGVLRPGKEPKTYTFDATLADGSHREFTGKRASDSASELVLTAANGEGLRRITITPRHDTRLIVKLEAQNPGNRMFYQLGEVGYTREGVSFAAGDSSPVCIVTEGRGTTPVMYKGKTYYVCCSGCRDLFKENPEAVLAEAAAREKAKK